MSKWVSSPGRCSPDSGMAVAAQELSANTGTFNRKAHRHPGPPTSQPPTNGPTAPASPPSPDQAPTAGARSSGRKLAWIRASDAGVRSAAPTPCSTRAATSTSIVGAAAQPTDATPNQTEPMRNNRRRPKRSPSAPPSRMNDANVSM